jgi:hypothetical protein
MLKIALLLLAAYAAMIFLLYVNQRHLIYFPHHFSPPPADAGVPEMQVVTLETTDGLALKAWYRPPTRPELPTIVYFHGNAGHIGLRGRIVKPFLEAGYGVLLVTYRGYSGNPGEPYEEGLYQDGRAAIDFLQRRSTPDACMVLYGESIGTGVAVQLATEYRVGALILQSPFTSLGDVGQLHYPFFPVKWLIKDSFNSLKKANQIHSPTLVLYGHRDDIIPSQLSIQLFEALPAPKRLAPLADVGHNDPFDFQFAIKFIREYVKCESKNS